jgi:Ni,Fe-hydrogenase III small subunit/ferredoxin
MLEWILRGLGQGQITTAYPRVAELPPPGYRGSVEVLDAPDAPATLAELCPTGAITVREGEVTLDRGRCILCGNCVESAPERFRFQAQYETAARAREGLVLGGSAGAPSGERAVGQRAVGERAIDERAHRPLGEQAPALRRSIHVRHIDCGSDGSEEWEVQALWNPFYDIQRLGFFLTAAPRHADVLIVTGAVTAAMREPLERTWQVMPAPKALVAVGTDACSGGLCAADELTAGGVDAVLAADVYVPGSPPAPIAIMDGLLLATGLLRARGGDA